jgi:hypothetical protein
MAGTRHAHRIRKGLWDALSVGEYQSDLKEYCIKVANADFQAAFEHASKWTPAVNALMDDPDAVNTEGRRMMLAVFKHFIDALGVDFERIVTT